MLWYKPIGHCSIGSGNGGTSVQPLQTHCPAVLLVNTYLRKCEIFYSIPWNEIFIVHKRHYVRSLFENNPSYFFLDSRKS